MSALSVFCSRRYSAGRNRVQMLSADSRARKSRTALGSPARWNIGFRGIGSLTLHRRSKTEADGQFSRGMGRHRLTAIAVADYVDGRAPAKLFLRRVASLAL